MGGVDVVAVGVVPGAFEGAVVPGAVVLAVGPVVGAW